MMRKCLMILLIMGILAAALMGCTKQEEKAVPVQSVAMILGFENAGEAERYGGIVVSRGETKINKDPDKSVKELLVKTGDMVSEGDVLFTYDMDLAALNLEKAQLELDQMNGTVLSKQREIEQLTTDRDRAREEDKLSYTLEIEACETDIREQNYNIALKEKEVERLTASLEVLEFTSPVSGRVRSIADQSGYGDESGAYMTIIEAGTYRVMGYVNENNLGQLFEGSEMLVRSRLDDSVWTGYIERIDWENPANNDQNMYYGPVDAMSGSTRYPFYIELDDSEGLLLGQHVYIEANFGQNDREPHVLALPEGYLLDPDGKTAHVYAESAELRIEKRAVILGEYDELLGTYVIESGLTEEDYIAWPSENVKVGMRCTEFDTTAFEPEDGDSDEYIPAEEMFFPEEDLNGEEMYDPQEELYGHEEIYDPEEEMNGEDMAGFIEDDPDSLEMNHSENAEDDAE